MRPCQGNAGREFGMRIPLRIVEECAARTSRTAPLASLYSGLLASVPLRKERQPPLRMQKPRKHRPAHLRCPHGGHGLDAGPSAQPGSGSRSKCWPSSATTSRYSGSREPHFARDSQSHHCALRDAGRMPAFRTAHRPTQRSAHVRSRRTARQVCARRGTALRSFIRYLHLTSRAPPSTWPWKATRRRLPGMSTIPAWRPSTTSAMPPRALLQHHARALRQRLEAQRSLLRASHAARCRTLSPVLPRSAALRRRELRPVVPGGFLKHHLPWHRRRTSRAPGREIGCSRLATATTSRLRSAASWARRS